MNVQVFSKGKKANANEDSYGHSGSTFVVCDGSTSKAGGQVKGKTGGEIASQLLVQRCLETDVYGIGLVARLTDDLAQRQRELGIKIDGKAMECASTLLCVKLVGDKIIVTQVADTAFRINGTRLYQNRIIIDELLSRLRAQYIELTGDVPGGRDYIMPLLLDEQNHCNNANSPVGYGVINGNPVPEKFIQVYEFDKSEVKTIEIFTDGYFAVPAIASIDAYEETYTRIEHEDPDKCRQYLSTKSKDDRTVMIVSF